MIEELLKTGTLQPFGQMRDESLAAEGLGNLNQRYGVEAPNIVSGAAPPAAKPLLPGEGTYETQVGSNPPASEKSPRVVSIAK